LITVEKYLGFDDSWLILIGIPVVTLVVSIMNFGVETFSHNAIPCISVGLLFTVAYWLTFRQLFIAYHKKFDNYRFDRKRLVYIMSRLAIFYIVVKAIMSLLINLLFPSHQAWYDANKISPFIAEVSEIMVIALVFFIYEGIYYFNKSRLIEIEKNQLEKLTAEQTLSTLKNQVNPHFLFNSLNTLVSLIPEDKDQAINFVQELSKTYRTILEVRDEKLITIATELDALDSYIYLLKTRFQGKILIVNKIKESVLNEFILPISLQILIENAVKHNIVSNAKPLKIELLVEDDYLVVRNNLQKKNQEFATTKVGLTNIRDRYKFMTKKEVVVRETKDQFIVKLPIIRNSDK